MSTAEVRRTRMTSAVIWVVAAGVLLVTLSGTTHDGWLVLLAALGFGIVGAALVLRPRLDPLDVAVLLPDRARAGDTVTAHVTVTNTGSRSSSAAVLHLHAPGLRCATVAVPALAPGGTATAEAGVETFARVALVAVTTVLQSSAPFGLVVASLQRDVPAVMLVHPVRERPLQDALGGSGEANVLVRPAPGVDVQGIREWRRGDSARRLYARGTARHGRPLVLDRHDDLGSGLAMVVGGSSTHPLWEGAVAVVASTLVDAVAQGRRTAAVTNQAALPDLVGGDAQDQLDWCTRVCADAPPRGDDVRRAAEAIGHGGTVVVADVHWTRDAAWWTDCVAAADAADVALLVLHPFADRQDALCVHEAHAADPHSDEAGR